MSFIAPQAYTKETLSKAFDWLQYQPDQVKQVATSPDALVGLFLKAQRQGLDHIDVDAPVSSKKFIADLKSLKKDIAQFEENPSVTPSPMTTPTAPPPVFAQPPPQATNSFQTSTQTQVSQTMTVSETKSIHTNTTLPFAALDPHSLQAIQIVQERFNLSSQQEALRMLIAVGAKQVAQWP
jgi:hypothetical protein